MDTIWYDRIWENPISIIYHPETSSCWTRPEAVYFLTELTLGAEGEPYQQQQAAGYKNVRSSPTKTEIEATKNGIWYGLN